MILNIETSTNVCSVALGDTTRCELTLSDFKGQNHAALLGVFVQQALDFVRNQNVELQAVAVSAGPGSYTGLRIGVSTAKGLCFGKNIPLIAIDTLQIMNVAARKQITAPSHSALFCPMLDARRMEVYCKIFDEKGNVFRPTKAEIVDENSFADLLSAHQMYFFGNGAEKCKTFLTAQNAHFVDNIVPLAENMLALAAVEFHAGDFADTAYFEPFYLKEFQATKAKKMF